MTLKIEQTNCANCGYKLTEDWSFCPSCGASRENFFMQCSQCHHVLTEATFTFCPYCRFKLPKAFNKTSFTFENKDASDPFQIEKSQQSKVSFDVLYKNLKFEPKAMSQVLYSKNFTIQAILLIAIASFFNAIVLSFSPVYSTSIIHGTNNIAYTFNIKPGQFLLNFFTFFLTLVLLGFIYNLLLHFIDVKDENANYIRTIGSYAPIFLLMDGVIIFVIYLSNLFATNQNNYFQITEMYGLFLFLILIYIVFHLIITTIKSTQLGTGMVIVLIFFTLILDSFFGFYYFQYLLKALLHV